MANNATVKREMPCRIQRKRSKGWRMPENTIYVGRGSKWGNPFRVGHVGVKNNRDAVRLFYRIIDRPEHHKFFVFTTERIRLDLRGKNLACWCKDGEPCHADVLLKIANNQPTTE